ncbi:glycerol-3-phosphate 1-O-acyltransferase PlsY [Paenibacillus doosanensis]|uniref:Glycerol-3-phosphate acyltransferase n=1 Tax=Paenibacillus konkukensis TaxID=2020716 RepID=A0ABY4RJD1_9BACL|nr:MULTISPECIES: glycerol-3-phosphate 1-O-acyltransferase PlsY [Paenibacillus]MCS7462453.1 glycerol-3-phosphate 1-O-acyltransferase PlsY [Paenibacillus doosanensis]UQZ81940.1 Glycerol-3-phosphate acyltransferase [Paenibacillus konkukensis]
MLFVISIIIAYLLGSISFSYLAGKLLKGIDIREHGSGNAGATNTLRILGVGPAVTVLILDALKGVAGVLIGRWLGGGDVLIEALCGLAAISGHNWPIYFGFRGGKGIATTIGVMITVAPMAVVYAGIVCILAIVLTRYVSLGSLLFTALLPLFIWFMQGPKEIFWLSLFVFVFAWFRHRGNIVKLVKGQESKIGSKK